MQTGGTKTTLLRHWSLAFGFVVGNLETLVACIWVRGAELRKGEGERRPGRFCRVCPLNQ
eukprot:2114179-Rhodomonas_salina.1